jgi:hypothetical protein
MKAPSDKKPASQSLDLTQSRAPHKAQPAQPHHRTSLVLSSQDVAIPANTSAGFTDHQPKQDTPPKSPHQQTSKIEERKVKSEK